MELASRWNRLAAALIDGFLGALPYGMVSAMDSKPVQLLGLGLLLAFIAYQVYSVATRGQTIAKRLLGIRVVRKDTMENGGFTVNVLRRGVIPGLLNFIPGFFIVDSLFIFREDRRTVHDMIAGTVVVAGQPGEAAPAA